MEIVIHLGLHRTGSTALQAALARARGRLAPHGVGFPALPETRPQVAYLLGAAEWRGPRGLAARMVARRRLRDWARAREAEGHARLLLSDETLAGDLDPCLAGLGPYPHARARLSLLAEAFAPWRCKAAAALRDPAEWLVSARAFALSRRPQPDFAPARAAALSERRSWRDLAADIHAAFPAPTFWDAGFYETRPRQVHRLLVGAGAAGAVRGAKRQAREGRVNPSLPAGALAALEKAHAAGEAVDDARRAALVAEHGGASPRWDPWTAEERALLAERYRADLDAIRAMGLTVLTVDGPGAEGPKRGGRKAGRKAGRGLGRGAGEGPRTGAKPGARMIRKTEIRGDATDLTGPGVPPVIATFAPSARQGGLT